MSNDLITFLRARLDEDERLAKECERLGVAEPGGALYEYVQTPFNEHAAARELADHFGPARVLAEVAAKRGIIDRYEHYRAHVAEYASVATYAHVLRVLAQPFAGHPDYREEWKP